MAFRVRVGVLLALALSASAATVVLMPTLPAAYDEYLALLTLQGLANRHAPRLWLSSNATAPGTAERESVCVFLKEGAEYREIALSPV